MQIGVLFADLRGFTARSEGEDPHQTVALLRRFYACAERVLFPDALIDKLIGDAVMALYVPEVTIRPDISQLMLDHARALLEELGYGSEDGPFAEAGIGLDFGEAFVGNIGDRSVYDFTAVGDVVNTASRLQAQAAGGEVVYSARVAADLGPASRHARDDRAEGEGRSAGGLPDRSPTDPAQRSRRRVSPRARRSSP